MSANSWPSAPKDGDIFVLDSGNLGHYTKPLTRQTFANSLVNSGNDTKGAIGLVHTTTDTAF